MTITEDIKILLDPSVLQLEQTNAALRLVNICDFHLDEKEILYLFYHSRKDFGNKYWNQSPYKKYLFLYNELLNNNKGMFIAITKYSKVYFYPLYFVSMIEPYNVGIHYYICDYKLIKVYKILLDYNDFDVYDLEIPDRCKLEIQKYKTTKYSGKLTKSAIKN